MYTFENICGIQVDAQGARAELNPIGSSPIEANRNVSKIANAGQCASLAGPALLLKLDRENLGCAS
jgi:hypothetical protein